MPAKTDIKLWGATATKLNGLTIVTYTCPVCNTGWTINVASTETQTQVWCHKDGNNSILFF